MRTPNFPSPLLLTTLVLLIHHHLSLSSARRCHPDDETALLKIKSHFNNAPFFSSWTTNTPCCRHWKLVRCKPMSISNSKTHRVNFLEISGEDAINGLIPSAVGDLPYLETLIFRLLPNLTGPIPPAISKLTRLQFLLLNWNALSGPIPASLGRLSNLSTLGLNNNRLSGPIPASLGRIPKLAGLSLDHNRLTGSIPPTFGLLHTGASLQLSHNRLSGPIPRSLGRANFGSLELAGNRLTGDAWFLFGKGKSYVHLDLSWNRLSFDLGNTELDLEKDSLLEFDLSHNMIYGRIPAWLGRASDLATFNVSYNRLCGAIPAGKLQSFGATSFQHNRCLCGFPMAPCN